MSDIKDTLDGINDWLDIVVEKVSELEDLAIEMIQNEIHREKIILKNEKSISDLWGKFKQHDKRSWNLQKKRDRKGWRKHKEIMAEKIQIWLKLYINQHIQEPQQPQAQET